MQALLFPGLDALFVTSKMKRWLPYDYIKKSFQRSSQVLSELTGQNEDLETFLITTHRPHLVDLDRTLIALTTLQVAVAQELATRNFSWNLIQGCSHGDIARSVLCNSIDLEKAIHIMWNFSSLRKMLPEGMTCTVRTQDGSPLTGEQKNWLSSFAAPISQWSTEHGTIGTDLETLKSIQAESKNQNLKIKEMLPFPVHSSTLKPVFELLRATSSLWPVENPKVSTFSSVWLRDLITAEDIVNEALAGAVEPVLWCETLEHLYHQKGIRSFINVGPSNTLTSWLFNNKAYQDLQLLDAWELLGNAKNE